MADAIYVAVALPGLPRETPAPGKPCGENCEAFDRGFHRTTAHRSAQERGQNPRAIEPAAAENRGPSACGNRRAFGISAGRWAGLFISGSLRGNFVRRRSAA